MFLSMFIIVLLHIRFKCAVGPEDAFVMLRMRCDDYHQDDDDEHDEEHDDENDADGEP